MSALDRFVEAQEGSYAQALEELRGGRKRSHWMWFIFPQLKGLGRSAMAQHYGIEGLDEARAYLAHPVLGLRLHELLAAVMRHAGSRSAEAIFGDIDAMKLRSSLTIFEAASEAPEMFAQALDALFEGKRDPATLARL